MNNELLSVVDENDCVIDTCARHIIHATGLRHRAVHILVFNEQGQLFLQKRSMKKISMADFGIPRRRACLTLAKITTSAPSEEIEEELGISAIQRWSRCLKYQLAAIGMEFIQVYRCIHNGPFNLAPDEIDEGDWFSVAEIAKRISA
jgi:isopentenyldiphosphate isomerase